MSADANDAATKSPFERFFAEVRAFLGRAPESRAPDENRKKESGKDRRGPGSSLIASMLGRREDDASVTIAKPAARGAAGESREQSRRRPITKAPSEPRATKRQAT